MASKIVVNLDTSKELYGVFKCKQNDDLTLEAYIFDNGAAKDLTNSSIVVQAKKADNTYIIQNTGIIKGDNKFIGELVKDFTRVPGKTEIEVVLTESGKQNTTFSFCLEVIGSVIRGAEESKDLITSLEVMQDAVVEMGKISDETKKLINNSGAASKEEINKVNAHLAEIATTGTTIEVVQNKVSDMAEKGLIQAYTLADGTLDITKTTFANYYKSRNIFDGTLFRESSLNASGIATTTVGATTTDYIKIEDFLDFIVFSYNGVGIKIRSLCFYDENKTFKGSRLTPTNAYVINLDKTAKYFRASFTDSDWVNGYDKLQIEEAIMGGQTDYISHNEISATLKKEYLSEDNSIFSLVEKSKNMLDFSKETVGYYINSYKGELVIDSNYNTSDYIYVCAGKQITITGTIYKVRLTDMRYRPIFHTSDKTNYSFTPTRDGYLRISYLPSQKPYLSIQEGSSSSKIDDFGYKLKKSVINDMSKNSKWSNKRVLVISDSITDDNYGNFSKWATVLKGQGIFGELVNNSIHATGYLRSEDGRKNFQQRIDEQTGDFDLIILFGSVNDLFGNFPIGTSSDSRLTHYKPAVEWCLDTVIKKWINATICVATPMKYDTTIWGKNPNSQGLKLKNYVDVIIECAKERSIPIFNLYEESNFHAGYTGFNERWTMLVNDGKGGQINDGLHPNEKFESEKLAPKFSAFLQTV